MPKRRSRIYEEEAKHENGILVQYVGERRPRTRKPFMAVDGVCGCSVASDSAVAQECGAGEVLALAGGFDKVSGSLLALDWAWRFAAKTAPSYGADTDGGLFRGGCDGAAVRGFSFSGGELS